MFLSKPLGNKCSESNFLLDTVRNKLFLFTGIFTAVRNALFPFGSNCSFSCPTGTELFLIEVFFVPEDECYVPRINGNRFRIRDKGTGVPFCPKCKKEQGTIVPIYRRLSETTVHHLRYTNLSKHISFNYQVKYETCPLHVQSRSGLPAQVQACVFVPFD